MKKLIAYFLLILLIVLFIFAVFKRPTVQPVEETYIFFDTFVRISLYPVEGVEGKNLFHLIEKELQRIQNRFGYGSASLASELTGQQEEVVLSEEDMQLLRRAVRISDKTEGAFDVTVGLLEQVWGFKSDNPHLPQEEEIANALRHTGYQHLKMLEKSIVLKKGFVIDLGGISKGYAVDRAVQLLKNEGIQAGLVDAGGDLRVFGKKPDGKKWVIGIKHPQEQGAMLGTFKIDSGAVATSGNYERSFTENGMQYHHIIDPRTGYPATSCISVTIIADNTVTADAFATAIFVLGPDKGMELVKNLSHIEGVIAFEKNGKLEVITSRGICLQ
jgi:thiamine biosynthesis lipoprotein